MPAGAGAIVPAMTNRPPGADRPDDTELCGTLRRINLDEIIGVGGLRPIRSFAPRLPSVARSIATTEPARLASALGGLSRSRQEALITAFGAVGVAEGLRESSRRMADHIAGIVGQLAGAGLRTDFSRLTTVGVNGDVTEWTRRITGIVTGAAKGVIEWRSRMEEGFPAFVERHGWPIPILDLTPAEVSALVELRDSPRREVSREIAAWFGPRTARYRRQRNALLESDLVSTRRPALEQAIRAHTRGDYYASICTMLPLVEGVMADSLWIGGPAPQKGVVPRGLARMDELSRSGWSWVNRSLEIVLLSSAGGSALFGQEPPGDRTTLSGGRLLNRHSILHGRSRRYGTAANALRLFLLLCTLVEVLEDVHRVAQPTTLALAR